MKPPSSAVFASLSSTIAEICRLSGIRGVAIGVIDHGEIIHRASYGFCDVEKQIPCDSDSTFVLDSLTKAFTSALLAQLLEEGRLNWTDPLSQILPEFQREPQDLSSHATIGDLLCHHTGFHVPQQQPFHGSFVYNNFAYEALGHVIEKVSGTSYSSFLHERLLRPLGMKRTYFTDPTEQVENEAKPYAALSDATLVRISPALQGDRVLMGPAGGVRSCLGTGQAYAPKDHSVSFSELPNMWTGWNILPMPLVREHSYGYGWVRSQLPSVLAPSRGDPDLDPLVGTGAPSRLAIWHKTKQAVVVLTNSLSLNYGARYINDLVIEALLDNLDNAHDYVKLAKKSSDLAVKRVESIQKELVDGRTRSEPSRPLDSYVGRYFNAAKNFFIEVGHNKGNSTYRSWGERRTPLN
ncbi:hypothetical protein LCI18_002118 [Fusarium solani-melongenae]|uniref:Uncharacterized protein n=1 Tax=Fusarium solani subsp. cucurbitae TaxID=2747967 RepID=A0ACD3YQQ1_FUSSC|nr:hypothetical protein LCI18_002118 [Fusarium solani-melongenae]